MKKYNLLCVFLICFALVSCDILGIGEEDDEVSDADIVLGKRVEDIHLGDTLSNVYDKYGKPEGGGGVADGTYRAWYPVKYISGELNGVGLWRTEAATYKDSSGIVDKIKIEAPYQGSTKHGISIGKTKEFVKQKLGKPDNIYTEGYWQYCVDGIRGKNEADFSFEQDSLKIIWMGDFLSYGSEAQDCNFDDD